ncbi:hypothetical protein EVAR_11738_1 [Eumeta japonica]|uniref:Uncharacterized protein n=1 Tax=Eumeta variegata TaxID=151549 RepID=A0A4C1UPM4_EUMVA|nr:hypothetical protein EVAR_11738_1 [Eumeta japonica]
MFGRGSDPPGGNLFLDDRVVLTICVIQKSEGEPTEIVNHRQLRGIYPGWTHLLMGPRLTLVAVPELKTGRGTESRLRTESEIDNETGVKIECGKGTRIESLIGIEI